jgi:hypothetical protein
MLTNLGLSPTDNVSFNDLELTGTINYVNETNLQVEDKSITLNKNGTDATSENAGIIIERPAGNQSMLWDSVDGFVFSDGIKVTGNLNLTGAIQTGSITSGFGDIDIGTSALSAGSGNFSNEVNINSDSGYSRGFVRNLTDPSSTGGWERILTEITAHGESWVTGLVGNASNPAVYFMGYDTGTNAYDNGIFIDKQNRLSIGYNGGPGGGSFSNFLEVGGSIGISGTTVIDSSRNLTNIGSGSFNSDVFVGSNITLDASTGISKANDHQDPSDRRIKEIIDSDVDPLSFARNARLHYYDKRGLKQFGLFAQDLMKADGRIVGTMDDDEFGEIYTLSGYSVASIALAGVGKVDGKLKRLEEEVKQLREQVTQLGGVA